MNIVIIDYGAGNIKSIQFAIRRLGYNAILSNNTSLIQQADKVIFPGVGHANSAMKKLKDSKLDQIIPNLTQPVLGICLGMQLMCKYTEEGAVDGLGIFPISVYRFPQKSKIPHTGWNTIEKLRSPLFNSIQEKEYTYFVHSFYAPISDFTIAQTEYIIPFSAALQKGNFLATQFHPEKSSSPGERILSNFLNLNK
ncbi:imidazole glycerol phosphate synthase subunit HisH [Mesonia aquimarina]|uniref:imidazole glycerol phosphate synthase subunit HisH n=1 Tax=Mesonia aquimarina TaxID=1504967 RepID=UPI000EF5EE6A|nr:imidazole glycerol phosphate synthase subunit HisH [Mesonia aquimarina]